MMKHLINQNHYQITKNLNRLSENEKLQLFQVEELETRLEMGGWGGDDSCNNNCTVNNFCNSCCGDGNPCCNDQCGDFGCYGDLDLACVNPV